MLPLHTYTYAFPEGYSGDFGLFLNTTTTECKIPQKTFAWYARMLMEKDRLRARSFINWPFSPHSVDDKLLVRIWKHADIILPFPKYYYINSNTRRSGSSGSYSRGSGGGEHLSGHARDPFLTGNYFWQHANKPLPLSVVYHFTVPFYGKIIDGNLIIRTALISKTF